MQPTPITVTSMLSVIIPRDLIIVPVRLDTLEMEVVALVRTRLFSLFVCGHVFVLLDFVVENQSLRTKLFSSVTAMLFSVSILYSCETICWIYFSHVGNFPS